MNHLNDSKQLTDTDLKSLFNAIDRKDAASFAQYLTPDINFRFGNAPIQSGKASVSELVQAFFDSIQGLQHELMHILRDGPHIVCRGEVTYTRHDGSHLKVPFSNYFDTAEGLIKKYQIYVDSSALYEPGTD